MKQLNGGISVDEGYRTAVAGKPSSSRPRTKVRADRAEPGEDLGVLGSEPWNLPGQGDSGHRCGEWVPSEVCDECGHVGMMARSCGKRSCPNCWGMWAQQSSMRATVRVQAFRYTQPDNFKRQVAHATVSPPEGEVRTKRQYWDGKKKAAEIAKEKGFRGFAVIPHPYRVKDEGKRRYEAEVERDSNGNPVYGVWVWLRNDVEDMDRYIYWSPHYHIIGSTSQNMAEGSESDQWVYSFIRSLKPFDGSRDTEAHEDVYGTFRYLLSHTGYPEGSTKQAVTWHGCLANSVFVEDATEDWQHEKPSEGVMSVLEREIEEVADGVIEDSGEGSAREEETEKCDCEDCDGEMIDVFDVEAYLRQCNPPPEVIEAMTTARDWRIGRVSPPPGMQRPQTEEQAREAFEVLR